MCLDRPPLAVKSEDLAMPLGWSAQPEEQPDGGRLTRPVGPEIADHLPRGNLEI